MARLVNISGKEAVRAFAKAGWQVMGQVGSHSLKNPKRQRQRLVIPSYCDHFTQTHDPMQKTPGVGYPPSVLLATPDLSLARID
jgi:predicted RNA binding protein YcfA (HicA-like mRNA interferase family)